MTIPRALVIASATVVVVAAVASDYGARRQTELALAVSLARVDALERDLGRALGHDGDAREVAGTTGRAGLTPDVALLSAGITERVKDDLRSEVGLSVG